MQEYSIVGKPLPRVDGPIKATGKSEYTVDMTLPQMLYGKILRSPYPHAHLLHIDTSKAERLAGVKALISWRDTPGIKYSLVPQAVPDLDFLARDKVRYIGDEIMAVAALDEDTAEEALELIQVDYEPLPAVFHPEEAMRPEAPKIHDHAENNISAKLYLIFGDLEKGFEESDCIREDRFTTQTIAHCALEPHGALAQYDSSGKLTIWMSNMGTFFKRKALARALDMPESMIRVARAYVGGGFGGKIDPFSLDVCAALLSKKSGRPVKICYTREEVFTATRQNYPMIIELKTGVKKDGRLMAKECRLIADCGAYHGSGQIVVYLCSQYMHNVYRVSNVKYEGLSVYTNKSIKGPQRSHGHVQLRFAEDSQLDMLAQSLGIDPLEIRLKNARQAGDELPNQLKITSCNLTQCLKIASEESEWPEKWGKPRGDRGLGMGAASFLTGVPVYPLGSSAMVKIDEDGCVSLLTGAVDIGTGCDTILCQIAAEELGVDLADVRLNSADTEINLPDIGSFVSALTHVTGNAVRTASRDAKRQLLEVAALKLEAHVEDLAVEGKKIYVKGSPERGITFRDAAFAGLLKGKHIMGKGSYKSDLGDLSILLTGIGRYTPTFSFGATVVEMEVDPEIGQVKLKEIWTALDCGFPINPAAVEGQIEGSVSMGQGHALSEQLLWEKGQILNPSFSGYGFPLSVDTPEIRSIHLPSIDPEGPFGAKEAGETNIVGVAAAIANALWDSVEVRLKNLPLTPEAIIEHLEEKKSKTG